MNNFLPQGYEAPSTESSYTKFEKGDIKLRILNKPIMGYQYWTTENKPVRSQNPFTDTPNIKLNDKGEKKIDYFWALEVYNYNTKKQEVAVITQKTLINAITNFNNNADWGSPLEYDIVVNKKGDALLTEYNVMPSPKKELSDDVKSTLKTINLEALYTGTNPFDKSTVTVESVADDMNEVAQAF